MKKRKHIVFLLVLFIVFSAAAGCRKQEEEPEEFQKIQIGISFDTYVLERWTKDRDMFVSTAGKGKGAQVDVQSANGDVEVQITQIEEFIAAGKDVIVIVPVDCEAVTDVVQKALDAEIKVISYDRLVADVECDLYISFDNGEVGRMMAEAFIERLPDGGKIMMICGPKQDHNSGLVADGFKARIAESNLEIVYESAVKDWTPEYGAKAMESVAAADISEIDGIMCGNDGLAGYAIQALSEQRMAGQKLVVAQDADLDACQRIVEGTQTMTVYKDVNALAKKAAEYAVMLGQGLELNDIGEQIKNGDYYVPYLALDPVAVTVENMEEVITNPGFHLYDQVYLYTERDE